MIEKTITFQSKDDECSIEKISPNNKQLEKIASGTLSEEIKVFIEKNIKSDPRYVYVLVSALGSGEVWGPNINGDFFPEEQIKNSYKTFEEIGHVFTHHKNKDPEKSVGDILFAHWNPRMHRVELIVRVDRQKAPKIAADIDRGKMWDVSMGCKVPYDVCSICHKKAKTRDDYCEHIKYKKGKVLADGRQVYMINMHPRFFDISFVFIGADRTAKSLMKVANALNIPYEELLKKSDIEKEIKGDIISKDAGHMASILMEEFDEIKPYEENIPNNILDELSPYPMNQILSSLLTLGIILKPHEFQRIYLIKTGENPDYYEKEGLYIDSNLPIPERDILNKFKPFTNELNYSIIKLGSGMMDSRSALKPYLYPRMIKMASEEQLERKSPQLNRRFPSDVLAVPGLLGAAAFYKKYLDKIPQEGAEGLDQIIKENPWVLPLVTAGSIAGVKTIGAKKRLKEKHKYASVEKIAGNLGGRIFAGVPAAYLASSMAQKSDRESKILDFIAKHPNLVALLGIGATNKAEDWEAIKSVAEDFNDDMSSLMSKTAANILESELSANQIMKDVEQLYENSNRMNKVANFFHSQNPVQSIGKAADVLVGGAVKKIISKTN